MRRGRGQTSTEYMAVISVVVVAVVSAAWAFIPSFKAGVSDLSRDVSQMLGTGAAGRAGPSGDSLAGSCETGGCGDNPPVRSDNG